MVLCLVEEDLVEGDSSRIDDYGPPFENCCLPGRRGS